MESINWGNYTGQEFQLFCNSLLSFEIGKEFRPFNAPGKDYGIDGYFEGQYNNKGGKWRFQYKFHNVARKQAISLLKADLKEEVKKLQDEDHFILLTNVEFLPQEFKSILEETIAELETNKSIEIWDGSKIFSLYLQFPLLKLWLTEGFTTSILLDYKVSFQKYLNANIEDPYTLGNYFIARQDKLIELNEFYQSAKSTAMIIGEAGIGKTRLIVEFFKLLEKNEESITCLVLMSKSFDFDKIKFALTGNKKIVILIDDAHEYSPEKIIDMITLCNLSPNVKLILSSRQLQFHNSFRLIKEYEQNEIYKLNLSELSRDDTKALFKHELVNHYLFSFLSELTEISHGKPILIVLLLKAAKSNTPIADIKKHNFLIDYVTNYFNSFCKRIMDECQISRLKANVLLQALCLLEPLNYNDTKVSDKIASILQFDNSCVALSLNVLKESGFVSGRYEFSIKPDFYSDIFLKNAPKDFIEKSIVEFPEYLNNIIINLSAVEEVEQSSSILDEILNFYVSKIKDENTFGIKSIFDTVFNVTYVKPEIAKKAVTLFIESLMTVGHSLSIEFFEYRSYFLSLSDSVFGKVLRVLTNLLYKSEFYSFVYNSIFQLNEVLKVSEPLTNVFKFSKTDFAQNYDLSRQLFFVEKFKSEFKNLSPEQLLFGIECCYVFLIHDFESTSWDGNGTQLTITTYYIPNSSKVKRLRKITIELFFETYNCVEDIKLKKQLLHKLLDIPRGIFATKNNKIIYKGDDEIESILFFLKAESNNFHFSFQKEVLDKLYWYSRWGIHPKFQLLIDEVKEKLKPDSFIEKLIHLFAKSESNDNYRKAEENIKTQSKKLIEKNSAEDIAEGLMQINMYHNNEFHYFHLFIVELTDNFSEKSQEVYNILWNNSKEFIYRYGANFLQSQYFNHKQEAFYWSKVDELLSVNVVQADDALLFVYTFHHASVLKLSDSDLALIEKIFRKKNSGNNFSLARALVAYLVNDKSKGEELCIEFLNECNNREAEIFFLYLHDNVSVIYPQLKNLFLGASVRFNLDYNIEICFNEICKNEGISTVLEYLIKRFEYKKASLVTENRPANYDFLPDGEHSHLLEGIEEITKYQLFGKALDWYISLNVNALEQLFAVELLDYLKQTNGMNTAHIEIFNVAIVKCKGEEQIKRLLEAITIFHYKDENLINLVIDAYYTGIKINSTDKDYLKDLNFKAYAAITTVGVKSGTAGLPFQVDIDLRDLVREQMKKHDTQSAAFQILKYIFNSVEKDIQDSDDRNNETW